MLYKFLESFKETTINHFDKLDDKIGGITRRQDITNGRIATNEEKTANIENNMMTKTMCKFSHMEKKLTKYQKFWSNVKAFGIKFAYILITAAVTFIFTMLLMMASGQWVPSI